MKKFEKELIELIVISLENTSRCISRDLDKIIFIAFECLLWLCFPDMNFYISRGIVVITVFIFTCISIKKQYEKYKKNTIKNKSEKNRIYHKISRLYILIKEIVFGILVILICHYILSIDSDNTKHISRGIAIVGAIIFIGIYMKKEYERYQDEINKLDSEKNKTYHKIAKLYKLKKDNKNNYNFISSNSAQIRKTKKEKSLPQNTKADN